MKMLESLMENVENITSKLTGAKFRAQNEEEKIMDMWYKSFPHIALQIKIMYDFDLTIIVDSGVEIKSSETNHLIIGNEEMNIFKMTYLKDMIIVMEIMSEEVVEISSTALGVLYKKE
jgi:hypothetical protein